jgi:FemAB-related protein (PEP-CTERM system-associated)
MPESKAKQFTNRSAMTATVRPAGTGDATRWDNYVNSHARRTVAHLWRWREILGTSFKLEPYYYIAENAESKVVGVLPTAFMKSVLFGRFLISLPWLDYGGPLADDDSIAGKLVEVAENKARELNCKFFEMRAAAHRLPHMTEKTDKRQFHLDLTPGEEGIWKTFDAKARNQVRKAEKSGLTCVFGGKELLDDFYAVFAYNMRDLGTPVWPRLLYEEIFSKFQREAEIVAVKLGEKTISAGLILHHGSYTGMPSASSYREYRDLSPNNLLYWETIKHALARGSKILDLGRSSDGAGTYNFKKQMVRQPTEQVWQYRLLTIDTLPEMNPDNPKYKLAIAVWRKLPLWLANRLGPKIVTKLP